MSDMLVIVTSGRGGCVLPSVDPATPYITSNVTNKTTKCLLDINLILGDGVTNITTSAQFH